MSYDGDTLTVLKGVTHGAVDFLIKPVRLAELSNMWQHVVRKRRQQVSDSEIQVEMGVRLYGCLSDDLEGDGRPGSASAAGAATCTGWSCRLLFNTLMTVPQYLASQGWDASHAFCCSVFCRQNFVLCVPILKTLLQCFAPAGTGILQAASRHIPNAWRKASVSYILCLCVFLLPAAFLVPVQWLTCARLCSAAFVWPLFLLSHFV
jgi:hypothetical protein